MTSTSTPRLKIVKPLLVRAANRRSIEELTKEIRAGQALEPGAARRYRATLAFLSVPRPLRSLAWHAAMSNPTVAAVSEADPAGAEEQAAAAARERLCGSAAAPSTA